MFIYLPQSPYLHLVGYVRPLDQWQRGHGPGSRSDEVEHLHISPWLQRLHSREPRNLPTCFTGVFIKGGGEIINFIQELTRAALG